MGRRVSLKQQSTKAEKEAQKERGNFNI